MSEFMWVKLCDGKRVKDPISQHVLIPGKAYKVKCGQFWLRRLECGDVEPCKAEKEQTVVDSKSKKKDK